MEAQRHWSEVRDDLRREAEFEGTLWGLGKGVGEGRTGNGNGQGGRGRGAPGAKGEGRVFSGDYFRAWSKLYRLPGSECSYSQLTPTNV